MIPKDCKRLAEVDFPIAEVSRHAAREKSMRHGHPSTLHLWWARRWLAACALLLALLWPDPCDPCCPAEFKCKAREILPSVQGAPGPSDEDLRKALLKFIADFANWHGGESQVPGGKSGAGGGPVREFSVTVSRDVAESLMSELRQMLGELGLADKVRIEAG
jgi:hypothetical protein